MRIALSAALLAPAAAVHPQGSSSGEKVPYVSLEEILSSFEAYDGKTVRTSGRLDLVSGQFRLRDEIGNRLDIVGQGSLGEQFKVEARTLLSRECEVTGYLERKPAIEGSAQSQG